MRVCPFSFVYFSQVVFMLPLRWLRRLMAILHVCLSVLHARMHTLGGFGFACIAQGENLHASTSSWYMCLASWHLIRASIMGGGEPAASDVGEREIRREKRTTVSRDAGWEQAHASARSSYSLRCCQARCSLAAAACTACCCCRCSINCCPRRLSFRRERAKP